MTDFSYELFTTRNLGFVSAAEQHKLRQAHVFVAGVGGMGGAAVACLARAGIGRFTIADVDRFEVSNLNRQMFATMDVIGQEKAEATRQHLLRINPQLDVAVLDGRWPQRLSTLLESADMVVNGCDDVRATLALMRAARTHRRPVIDAFASTLPNVYVVRPDDPRPEELFRYPSVGVPLDCIDEAIIEGCKRQETEWVLVHSSTAAHVELDVAAEMVAGRRARISFAPMVWMTGCLMAYEAVRLLLGRPGGPGPRGMFMNPWTGRCERPRGRLMAAIRRFFVRRFLARLAGGGA